ncbi:hypothetical protein GEMRC1_012127 [Eukaryota sp. GEM-RC1]
MLLTRGYTPWRPDAVIDRAEIFASSLPSNLLSVHNACQLPFSGRFLSLIPSCRDLTLQDSSLRWICRHRLLCSQDIVSCNLCSFLRLMLVTAQIVTAVLVIVLLDMTRSRISLPNTLLLPLNSN